MPQNDVSGSGNNHRLRVAYVVKRFPRLSQTFVLNEIIELERQGVEVEVFSLLDAPVEARHDLMGSLKARVTYLSGLRQIAGTQVEQIRRDRSGSSAISALVGASSPYCDAFPPSKRPAADAGLVLQSAGLAMLAARFGCHHLHAHFASDATTVAMLAARLSGIPFSFTAHARDIYSTYVSPEVDARTRRAKIAASQFVVTVSDYNRSHLRRLAGPGNERKIVRLYNGVDLDRLPFADLQQREPGLVLGVGRLVEKKGFGDLLHALAALRASSHPWRCVIVGEGPCESELRGLSQSLGIAGRVTFLGAKPPTEVLALMRRATVLAMPSVVDAGGDRDGLPTVLLEALASGLPAVATDITGLPEIIDDGVSGLLIPPHRPDLLAERLFSVMTDKALATRLARHGRQKAERQFDLKTNVRVLGSLFLSGLTTNDIAKGTGASIAARADAQTTIN